MPKTASKLARQLKVRYARARLTDPGYNLQLGSRYLANLIQAFGTPEAALAAYNAGEDRVVQWTAGQNYLETRSSWNPFRSPRQGSTCKS
jgi:soluble lytic murein transglycosylase-like protein